MRGICSGILSASLFAVACAPSPPEITASWNDASCGSGLWVTALARPGTRVQAGRESVVVPDRGGVPGILVPSEDLHGKTHVTVTITRGSRTLEVQVAIPGRRAQVNNTMLGLSKPIPEVVAREAAGWRLEFDACDVRDATSAEGTIELTPRRVVWRLPEATWRTHPIDVGAARPSDDVQSMPLPPLIVRGTDGTDITLTPIVTPASVLQAVAKDFPAVPMAEARPYTPHAPLLITGDTDVSVLNAPAGGVTLGAIATVAVVETKSVKVGDCQYQEDSGARTSRARHRMDAVVQVHEARTGRLIASTTLRGPAPAPCPRTLYRDSRQPADVPLLDQVRRLGAKQDFGFGFFGEPPDVASWLRRF
jgi:hypothetical protein